MSRTVSARIPNELHEELRERCNQVGCSINDYVLESIKFALYGSSDFDFEWEDESDEPEKPKNNEINPAVIRIE